MKPTPPPPKPTAGAENFLASQNYLGAADEFARLSQLSEAPVASQRYAMRAALAYIDAMQIDSAAELLTNTAITDEIASKLSVLATAMLAQKSPQHALPASEVTGRLNQLDARSLTPYQRGAFYRVAAHSYFAQGLHADAASAFNTALRNSPPAIEVSSINNGIWQSVSRLNETDRATIIQNGERNLVGWLALHDSTARVLHDAAALNVAITQWRSQFPAHPANDYVVEDLYEIAESLSQKASHIALLLPFEGRYKQAAEALRNGFLSGWFDDQDVRKPTVSVYSVNADNVVDIFHQAVSNGADFVVGPLEKNTIATLLSSTKISIPIFLLNQIEQNTLDNISANAELDFKLERVYQFALTPEDEANSVAKYAWSKGVRRIAAIAPQTTLGNRLINAFMTKWDELGGTVLQPVQYDDSQARYVTAVRQAFDLDASSRRAKLLTNTIGRTLIQEPRARRDVDGIFLAGLPVDNRQIIPQLRYFGVAKVPMFSSSHTYSGVRDPGNDLDLDGASFGDMAWILGRDSELSSYQTFRSNWPNLGPQSVRMYAFGLDAYALAPRVARFRYQQAMKYSGATGNLSVNRNGEVTRDLIFAKFVNGTPTILDSRF